MRSVSTLVLNHGRHGTSTAGGPPPMGPAVPEAPLGMLPSVSLATDPATRSSYERSLSLGRVGVASGSLLDPER
jgi:hypothetical protein